MYTEYVEETQAPIDKHISDPKKMPAFALDHISNKNDKLQTALLDHFEKDGEHVYERTQFLILFFAIETLVNKWADHEEAAKPPKIAHSLLWQARYSIVYSQMITQNVVHLQDVSL